MPRRERLIEASCVGGGSIAAAVAFTWPLILHLQTVARDRFDVLFQAWTINWIQYAVSHGANIYNTPMFVPERTTLAYSDTLLGVAIPTLPLHWLGMSPIGVLNVSILLGFATSAAAAYLLVRLVTGSRLAAAIGGAGYAFGPFGAVAARHLHVAMRPGVPLAAAAAWWLADRARARRPLLAPAIALVAVIGWQTSVSFYPGTYAIVAAAVVLAVRCRDLGRRGLVAVGGSIVAVGLIGTLLAIPNLEVAARYPNYTVSLVEFQAWAPNFGKVEPGLVVWGSILGHTTGDIPTATFPGATLLVLAVLGLVYGLRRRARRTVVALAVALTAVGAMLAVGTAQTGWRQYAPYRLLYDIGPPFNVLRGTARAWMIGLCGLGILAGFGAMAVVEWLGRHARLPSAATSLVVGTLVVVLVLVEGFDPWTHDPTVTIPAVDRELARLPGAGGVAYLPMMSNSTANLSIFTQPTNLYGETAHHRPMLNGYSGYTPPSYARQSRALWSLPSPSALTLLRHLGIRYVVVHRAVAGTPWAALRSPPQAAPLRYLGSFGGDELYEVPDA
jgi:hypothetical protein